MQLCVRLRLPVRLHGQNLVVHLKKAFNTVDHQLLCKKLEYYSICGIAYNWISDHLANRNQYVSIDGYSSGLVGIKCGVPQGSILGPKLFIPYINDVCNVSKLIKFIVFAADTNIFCSANNVKQLECIICRELSKLHLWFSINKLSLSATKTNYMLFSGQVQVPGK